MLTRSAKSNSWLVNMFMCLAVFPQRAENDKMSSQTINHERESEYYDFASRNYASRTRGRVLAKRQYLSNGEPHIYLPQ